MKLEVRKYYKNKIGNKCQILFQKFNLDFVYIDLKTEQVFIADKNGYHQGDSYSAFSLISEWVEPVEHEVEVWFYEDGLGQTYVSKSPLTPYGLTLNSLEASNLIAKVKVKFTEGEGL